MINFFRSNKLIVSIVAAVLVILIVFALWFFVFRNKLRGNDLSAYTMLKQTAAEFHSPKSVKVLSGTVIKEDTGEYPIYHGYFKISATNGFGAETTSDYFVRIKDGKVKTLDLSDAKTDKDLPNIGLISGQKCLESAVEKCMDTTNFDAKKVNSALERAYSKY